MIFYFILSALSKDPLDTYKAKNLIDDLYDVEGNILSHLQNLKDFATRFDFLMSHDQKLRNKVRFIQYKQNIKQLKQDIYEIPLLIKPGIEDQNSLLTIDNSSSIFQKMMNFGEHDKSFIFYPETKIASANKISFEETKLQNCLVKDFRLYFKYSDTQPEIFISDLTLYLNQTNQIYDFPSHVLFESLIIEPRNFWSNDTVICIPHIHVYGDKNFNL